MEQRRRLVLLRARVAALVACLLVAATTGAMGQGTAATVTIAGRVVAAATDQPIRRAWVVVRSAGNRTTRFGATDANGEFRFDQLPPGRYRVGASKRPYLSALIDAEGSAVTFRLQMGAAAFGVVLNESGQPANDVLVTLSGKGLPAPRTTLTNIRGEYRIHGLPAGEYQLETSRSADPRNIAVSFGEQLQVLPLELKAPTLVTAERPMVPPKPGTGAVGGRVLDVSTNQPLSGAAVHIGRTGVGAITDSEGRFRLPGLAAGTYSLVASQSGYFPLSPATVPLDDGAQVSDVTLRLGRHGSISGVVRDDFGDPLVGVPVRALGKVFIAFQPIVALAVRVLTDDRGYFRLDGLAPGEYFVCACEAGSAPVDPLLRSQLGLEPAAAATTFFPSTYYPGRTRGADAQVLAVDYSDDRVGADITLQPVTPFSVVGSLTENGASPSRRIVVRLFPQDDVPGLLLLGEAKTVDASPTGEFRLDGVPPGQYTLAAFPMDGASGLSAVVPIHVDDRDITGLELSLEDGRSVSGRLEFSGSSPRPGSRVLAEATVALRPLEISMTQLAAAETTGAIGGQIRPDANGRFTIPRVPPGQYKVSAAVPGTRWRSVESVATSAGGFDPDAILTIGPAGTDDLVVTLSDTPFAAVEGTITELRPYETPTSFRVMLFPADRSRWTVASREPDRFLLVPVTPARSFRFEVPAGDYFIALIPGAEAQMSIQKLEAWSRTATRVSLPSGATSQVQLKR